VRVCDGCALRLSSGDKQSQNDLSTSDTGKVKSMPSVDNDATKREEEEMQRAIALSLLETEKQATPSSNQRTKSTRKVENEEEDPELAAAIAASLKEMEVKDKRSNKESMYPSSSSTVSREKVNHDPKSGILIRASRLLDHLYHHPTLNRTHRPWMN
jgi:growth factor-regulated tyrosine kinase substrate